MSITREPAPLRGRLSASEIGLAGMRLLQREPGTILVWGLLNIVAMCGFGATMVATAGPAFMRLQALQLQQAEGQAPDPAAMFELMRTMAPGYLLVMAISLVFYAVVFGAVNRAILRPRDRGFAYLRIGGDELRQLGAMLLLGLIVFAIYIAVVIVAVIVAIVLGLTIGASAGASAAPTAVLVLIGTSLLVMVAMIFIMVRLSLVYALTFDRGRIDLFGSWKLTRGRFWALFGGYLLAWLVSMLLLISTLIVASAVAVMAGGGLAGAGFMFHPDMSSVAAYFGPIQIAYLAVSAFAYVLVFALLLGAPAEAYAQITGRSEEPAPPLERGFA